MKTPTPEQLRVPQPEKDFTVNRDWLTKLTLTAHRRCRRSQSGRDVLRPVERNNEPTSDRGAGFGSMLGGKMRALWAAGIVVLNTDGIWELTAYGQKLKSEAEQRYAAMRVKAGR